MHFVSILYHECPEVGIRCGVARLQSDMLCDEVILISVGDETRKPEIQASKSVSRTCQELSVNPVLTFVNRSCWLEKPWSTTAGAKRRNCKHRVHGDSGLLRLFVRKFVSKYCAARNDTRRHFSPKLNKWISKTALCLPFLRGESIVPAVSCAVAFG